MQTILKSHNFDINLTTHEHEFQCCVVQISKSLKVCDVTSLVIAYQYKNYRQK